MQTVQSYAVCVEQNITTLLAAVDGCRGALHLMHKDLEESENCLRYHVEQSRQHHQINLSLLHERDQMAREMERLRTNLASATKDIQQLTQVNDMLQKRLFELDVA